MASPRVIGGEFQTYPCRYQQHRTAVDWGETWRHKQLQQRFVEIERECYFTTRTRLTDKMEKAPSVVTPVAVMNAIKNLTLKDPACGQGVAYGNQSY